MYCYEIHFFIAGVLYIMAGFSNLSFARNVKPLQIYTIFYFSLPIV